jgi:hypothetical protein
MKTCLNHTHSDNVAGYCKLHKCGLTVKQIKCRNCLGKACWHLEKNEEHAWWRQREVAKQKRKERKEIINGWAS